MARESAKPISASLLIIICISAICLVLVSGCVGDAFKSRGTGNRAIAYDPTSELSADELAANSSVALVNLGGTVYPLRKGEAYLVTAKQSVLTRAISPPDDAEELQDLSPEFRDMVTGAGHFAIIYIDEDGNARVGEGLWPGMMDTRLMDSFTFSERASVSGVYSIPGADHEAIIRGGQEDVGKNIGWFVLEAERAPAVWMINWLRGENFSSYRGCVEHIDRLVGYGGADLGKNARYLPVNGAKTRELQGYVRQTGIYDNLEPKKREKSIKRTSAFLKSLITVMDFRNSVLDLLGSDGPGSFASPSQIVYGNMLKGSIVPVKGEQFLLSSEEKRMLYSAAQAAVNRTFKAEPGTAGLSARPQDMARLAAGVMPEEAYQGFMNMNTVAYVTLRHRGLRVGYAYRSGPNLADAVHMAAGGAAENALSGHRKRLSGALPDELNIEISIVVSEELLADLEGFDPKAKSLMIKEGRRYVIFFDKDAVQRNLGPESVIEELCLELRGEPDCDAFDGAEFYALETATFGTDYITGELNNYFRGNPLPMKDTSLEEIARSLSLAEGWLASDLNEHGYFNYLYYPSSGTYPEGRQNMIRQLMASRLLSELAAESLRDPDDLSSVRAAGENLEGAGPDRDQDSGLLQLHRKNLGYVFSGWYMEEGDVGYIYFDGKSKLGANAMAVRTLAASPYLGQYRDEADRLVNSILSLQQPDGSFRAFLIEPDYGYDEDYLLTFYSGEAVLSLLELYERTGEERLLEAAVKAEDFYTREYAEKIDENFYPAYVPWHTMALYRLYNVTGEQKYARAALAMNDRLIGLQNTDRKPYPDLLGRFYDPQHPEYGTPHSASDAVYTEGLAYAVALADSLGEEKRRDLYFERMLLGAGNLVNLQFEGANMYYLQHPERVVGAVRARAEDNYIRVDNTQHAIDAWRAILNIALPAMDYQG